MIVETGAEQGNIAAFARDGREPDRTEQADIQSTGRQLHLHLSRISRNPVQIEPGSQRRIE